MCYSITHSLFLFPTSSYFRVPCLLGALLCCHAKDTLVILPFPFPKGSSYLHCQPASAAHCLYPTTHQCFLHSSLEASRSRTTGVCHHKPCSSSEITKQCISASPLIPFLLPQRQSSVLKRGSSKWVGKGI